MTDSQPSQGEGTEPDARYTFANERTFLAWSRTALALVVAGLAVVQLLPPLPGVPWGRHILGLPLIVFGAVVAVAAYREWARSPASPDPSPDPASPGQHDLTRPGQHHSDEPGQRDPGLARERTSLAWTRTALSFAAVGGVILKREVIPGLIVLALAPAVWQLGRLPRHFPRRLELITATVVAVALVALVVALTH